MYFCFHWLFLPFTHSPSLSTAVLSAKAHPLLLVVDWLRWEPEDGNTFQGRYRNAGISQSVKKKLQQCKISSVFSIKSPKAIPRVRRKEGSHDNWRLNSIRCFLLMSLFPTPEWKLMMPSPGWCISSTVTHGLEQTREKSGINGIILKASQIN